MLMDNWKAELDYNQRVLYDLFTEFEHLEYWDKDLWLKCFDTVLHKKRLNNLTFFAFFHKTMLKMNDEPSSPLFKQLDDHIAKLKKQHYTQNREWRYNFAEAQIRPLQELIDRREESKIDDIKISKGGVD